MRRGVDLIDIYLRPRTHDRSRTTGCKSKCARWDGASTWVTSALEQLPNWLDRYHESGRTGGVAGVEADGGRIAARGYQYQYLRTLEALVSLVDSPHVASVRVEGSPEGGDADAVDFDVVAVDGRCLLAVQVKSSSAASSAADVFDVLVKLVRRCDAAEYQVLTNALPGRGAEEFAQALASAATPDELMDRLRRLLHGAR